MGAMVGLIRQWADQAEWVDQNEPENSAGVRTYSLWSLLGALAAYCGAKYQPVIYPIILALFGIFLTSAFVIDQRGKGMIGLTSYASGMITFLIGSLVAWGEIRIAVAVTAALGVMIAVKKTTHSFTHRLKVSDIQIALQFLVVTGVILPIVPNQGFGLEESINLYKIWWMVVLISGLGFCGYIGIRLLGAKAGIFMTGIAGGFASSTATTIALSRTSRQFPALSGSLGMGILLACTIMFARVWAIIFTLHADLAKTLILPFCMMSVPGIITILIVTLRPGKERTIETPEITNPLSLGVAIKFALLYAVVVFLVTLTKQWGADRGLYPVAFLSGLTDMDAIALSMTDMVKTQNIDINLASRGILIGAIANTIFKAGFALYAGAPKIRQVILIGMGSMVVAGVGGWFLL
jgi:uncharacterized membrane protein (DUF4010 family)